MEGNFIQLISEDEVIGRSKVHKIDKKREDIVTENITRNKKYHLLRWEIKRFLIRENIIKECVNWKNILDVFDPEILYRDNLTDEEIKEIFKNYGHKLIEHHTRYKEIHGVDEFSWMTPSEHRNLHNRLRKEGKCNIPPDELKKISLVATRRTKRHKEAVIEHRKSEYAKKYKSEYCKTYILRIAANTTLARNVRFHEEIAYNIKTDTLTISSGFVGDHGIKLPTVQIN